MIVGDMEIRLRADIARLQADMDRARQVVGGAMDRMSQAANVAKAAIGAIAGLLSVAAFASWVRGAIDAADAASKLSAKTGIAVKDLAGLQMSFELGGVGSDAMASAMSRLSKGMVEGNKTLEVLGVSAKNASGTFKSTRDVLYTLADKFGGMQDGAQKTALAIQLFGKSGADLIPMLNGGSEAMREMDEMAIKLGMSISEETAKKAEEFNDTMDLVKMGSEGVARGIAAELLPTLSGLAGSFLTTMTEGDKLAKTGQFLGNVFKFLYSAVLVVVEAFKTAGTMIGGVLANVSNGVAGLAEIAQKVMAGDFKGAFESAAMTVRKSKEIIVAVSEDVSTSWGDTGKTITGVWDGAGASAVEAMVKARRAATVLVADSETIAKAEAKRKKDAEAAEKALAKLREALSNERASAFEGAMAEVSANEALVATFGMTKLQIEALTVARMQDRLAQRASLELDAEDVAQMERMIQVRQRNMAAIAQLDELEQQRSMWASIEKTAHDTFVSIFDSGKSAFDRLRDTLKNGLLDLLYQMTIKKWIFNIGASVSGGGVAGLAQAATGGDVSGGGLSSVSGLVSMAKAAYSAISTGFAGISTAVADTVQGVMYQTGMTSQIAGNGAFATGAGTAVSYLGGAAVGVYGGRAISNGYSAIGGGSGNTAVNAGTAIGAAIGSVIPILGTAFGAAIGGAIGGLVNRAFGSKPKETVATRLTGTFSGDTFTGNSEADWLKKGGWFRSDKRGTDKTALTAADTEPLAQAFKAIKSATSDYASVLGLNADSIVSVTRTMNITMTKDPAKNAELVEKYFADLANTMALQLVPAVAQFSKMGESAAVTLQRITFDYAFLDQGLAAIGKTFGAVGVQSIAARERLIELSGGIENFGKSSAFFAQNFLSDAERLAPVSASVRKSMRELNLSWVDTREEFKNVVLGLDLTTETGAKTYAALMKVQEGFAQVYPAMQDATDAQALQAKARENLTNAYGRETDALRTLIDGMKSARSSTLAYKDSLSLGSLSTLTPLEKAAEAQRQYEASLAKVRARPGDAEAYGASQSAATAYLTASQVINASSDAQVQAVARVQADMAMLAELAGSQMTDSQLQLTEMEKQYGQLVTLNETVLSFRDALLAVYALQSEAAVAAAPDQFPEINYSEMGTANMAPLVAEIVALRQEVAALRADQQQQTGALMQNNEQVNMAAADRVVAGATAATLSAAWKEQSETDIVK